MGLHDQQIYTPDDPKILQVQKQAQLKMYEYNQTLPTEDAKRPDSAEKRPSRLHTRLMRFNSDLVSSYLQPDINKFPSAYNRRHGFRKIIPCRGVPT